MTLVFVAAFLASTRWRRSEEPQEG
jgi:hypothetical protein